MYCYIYCFALESFKTCNRSTSKSCLSTSNIDNFTYPLTILIIFLVHSHYYGRNHPSLGMVLLKLGKILVYIGQCSEAVGHLSRAESILKLSHGTSHLLYTQQLLPLYTQAKQEMQEENKRLTKGKMRKREVLGNPCVGPVR